MTTQDAIKELKDCTPLTGDDKNDSRYFEAVDMAIEALERTRWIPISKRLPTEQDANSKGKIVAWCTSFNGTEVELNWRLVKKDGVMTH